MANYLPDEVKMKALGYALYLPDPKKPYPAYVAGERDWGIEDESGRDFIKVYHQYGHVWIGASSAQGYPTKTVYNGVLPNEAFFDLVLKVNGRLPAALIPMPGHCPNKAQPGGCQLHNLFCGYPKCDIKLGPPAPPESKPIPTPPTL